MRRSEDASDNFVQIEVVYTDPHLIEIALATGEHPRGRPEETWRFMVELQTELGLVERFARECIALSTDPSRDARLIGLSSGGR